MVPLFLGRQSQRSKWTWVTIKLSQIRHTEQVSARPEKAYLLNGPGRKPERYPLTCRSIFQKKVCWYNCLSFLVPLLVVFPAEWSCRRPRPRLQFTPAPKASSWGSLHWHAQWVDMWQPEINEDISGNASCHCSAHTVLPWALLDPVSEDEKDTTRKNLPN